MFFTTGKVNSVIKKVENYYITNNEYKYIFHFKLFENVTSQKIIDEKQRLIIRMNGVDYKIYNVKL